MRGAPLGGDPRGHIDFVREDNLEVRRLTDHDKVEFLLRSQRFGPVLPGLLAHQSGEPDLVRQLGQNGTTFTQRPKHGGHRPLGVAGSATVELPVTDLAAERINCHSRHTHRVGVRGEKQTRLAARRRETPDDIRPARMHLAQSGLRTQRAEKIRDKFRAGLLADAVGAGVAVRIDAGNPHQRPGHFGHAAGRHTHREPVNLEKTSRAKAREPRSKRNRALSPSGHSSSSTSARNFCSRRADGEDGGSARGRFAWRGTK